MRIFFLIWILLFLLISPYLEKSTHASGINAAFIYNFMKYVKWPQIQGDFNVCVTSSLDSFSSLNSKKIRGQPIKVKSGASSDCHLIFWGRSYGGTSGARNVLTVCEGDDMIKQGCGISLVNRGGKIKFEVNTKAIKSKGLSPSSQLLKLAVKVIK